MHNGISGLGPVMLLECFGSEQLHLPVPLSLQGALQFSADGNLEYLDVDLKRHKVIASYAELGVGDRLGEAMVAELVRVDLAWVELNRWVRTDTWKRPPTPPTLHVLRDDEGSEREILKPSGDRYTGRPPLTAEQKVACWLHDRGFLHCRNWPGAMDAHPELKAVQQLSIAWEWLDADGSHPNHESRINQDVTQDAPNQEMEREQLGKAEPEPRQKPKRNWNSLREETKDNLMRRKDWRTWRKKHSNRKIAAYAKAKNIPTDEISTMRKAIRNADAYVNRYEVIGFQTDPK
ncbi:hypothetical protein [Aporhodopirellula aestuarii]|uniref:Uncharacterized protein n=1 Tax=Aporhodopirellula aestuarii TaxID=2950107 RepID=A0ABT0U4J6_9BACT|nr:hypothetical protein [Aporhodopirellula aestuarii]MCM2371857.1 hypothetical protein [Aporhodopirellula aestuarii]